MRPGWQVLLGQQRWPTSPHCAHTWLRHSTHDAVQPTPPPQHGWPAPPHAPPWHALLVHVPWFCGQLAPAATQVFWFWSQQPPPLHVLPSQHGWPGPPHCAHTLLRQVSAPSHVRFAQHASPAAPHWPHTPFAQPRPVSQVLFEQHGWPVAPHATQELLLHATALAVHRPPQHPWPAAPHPPQLPFAHAPKPGQVEPEPTQVPLTQQPPPAQVDEAQHAWPGPPHCAHTPPRQVVPALQGLAVWQHVSPGPPQPGGFAVHAQPAPVKTATTTVDTRTKGDARMTGL